jgi:phosphatidylinositol kinase/protein kinase (PI-3  family)
MSELSNSNIIPTAGPINSQALSNGTNVLFDLRFVFLFLPKINYSFLPSAWDTTRCFTKSDWFEWFRKLSITLLAESPSAALRCMAPLASSHQPVARQLFNAAFISCWVQLPPNFKEVLVKSIETVLPNNSLLFFILSQ